MAGRKEWGVGEERAGELGFAVYFLENEMLVGGNELIKESGFC